jgi:hypothetical protein
VTPLCRAASHHFPVLLLLLYLTFHFATLTFLPVLLLVDLRLRLLLHFHGHQITKEKKSILIFHDFFQLISTEIYLDHQKASLLTTFGGGIHQQSAEWSAAGIWMNN